MTPRTSTGPVGIAVPLATNSHCAFYPDYPMGGIMWYLGCKLKF